MATSIIQQQFIVTMVTAIATRRHRTNIHHPIPFLNTLLPTTPPTILQLLISLYLQLLLNQLLIHPHPLQIIVILPLINNHLKNSKTSVM